jgi:hypothetical protein
LICYAFAVARAACTSPLDCGLNGECVGGHCQCDSAWKGNNCTALNLLPMSLKAVEEGAYHRKSGATTWGGRPFRGDDGAYHLFVAELANNCTLKSW